jgi:hypothetical protein
MLFTLVFLLELLVNMSANLVCRFLNNPWSLFDLLIVGISLLSMGPFDLDFERKKK